MDDSTYRFGVGVLVLASALIAILLIVFFGAAPTFWVPRYSVTVRFDEAPGVEQDTPVRKNGVEVGRVASVQLLPGDEGVNLTLELDAKHQIRQGETCRISSGSLITGDAVVEFVKPSEASLIARFDGSAGSPKNGMLDEAEMAIAMAVMKDGDYLTGGTVAGDPLAVFANLQDNFAVTLTSIERAASRIDALAGNVQEVLGGSDEDFQAVIEKTKLAVETFNQTAETVRRVFQQLENSRAPEALAKALERLPGVIDQAQKVVVQTEKTLQSFEQVGGEFQGVGKATTSLLEDLQGLSQPLGERGETLVSDAQSALRNLDLMLVDARGLARKISSGQGTVGRLLEDEQLYLSLLRTIENIERTTVRLQPILTDVRTFADKVARDPRQLGVRGAIGGAPTGMGLK
jgi:phospholipid/cholesterol/gamma-HCH transport system substrate-binding protein